MKTARTLHPNQLAAIKRNARRIAKQNSFVIRPVTPAHTEDVPMINLENRDHGWADVKIGLDCLKQTTGIDWRDYDNWQEFN